MFYTPSSGGTFDQTCHYIPAIVFSDINLVFLEILIILPVEHRLPYCSGQRHPLMMAYNTPKYVG